MKIYLSLQSYTKSIDYYLRASLFICELTIDQRPVVSKSKTLRMDLHSDSVITKLRTVNLFF